MISVVEFKSAQTLDSSALCNLGTAPSFAFKNNLPLNFLKIEYLSLLDWAFGVRDVWFWQDSQVQEWQSGTEKDQDTDWQLCYPKRWSFN